MAGPALGITGALQKIRALRDQRMYKVAELGTEIAVQIHMSAPRGGTYRNAFGQNRSAEGEQPATEHGNLLQLLETPPVPTPDGNGYSFIVNYATLERGNATRGPRPQGQMVADRLKQEVSGGG